MEDLIHWDVYTGNTRRDDFAAESKLSSQYATMGRQKMKAMLSPKCKKNSCYPREIK